MDTLNRVTDILFCVACIAFIFHLYSLHYGVLSRANPESFVPFGRNLSYASLATHPLGETNDIPLMNHMGKFLKSERPEQLNYLQDIEEGQEVSESFTCPYSKNPIKPEGFQ